ncbi:hypothetical protein C8Q72DRAFT_949565 [Fomitopsis betulina]|nr:hypothetical protein C8Q72DRAFT_949565 [Fomitopsis betulina]
MSDWLPLELVQGGLLVRAGLPRSVPHGASNVPPAPPHAGKKHIASDPEEFNGRQLRGQCQHCLKHSGEGVIMRRCSACKLERYCSEATRMSVRPLYGHARLDALRAFTRKHRATVTAAAFMVVRHYYFPPLPAAPLAAPREDVLWIDLRTRPAGAHAATCFYVVGASIKTLGAFFQGREVEAIRLRLRTTREEAAKNVGPCAATITLFRVVDPGKELTNVMPFAFPFDPNLRIDLGPDGTWQEYLELMLNEGILQ